MNTIPMSLQQKKKEKKRSQNRQIMTIMESCLEYKASKEGNFTNSTK